MATELYFTSTSGNRCRYSIEEREEDKETRIGVAATWHHQQTEADEREFEAHVMGKTLKPTDELAGVDVAQWGKATPEQTERRRAAIAQFIETGKTTPAAYRRR